MKIFIDGKFFDKENAKISVYDHGLLYGDGVFEGIRLYDGKIYKLDEHINRLFESAKIISLDIWMSNEDVVSMVDELVRVNKKENGYLRIIITRGIGSLGIDPNSCDRASIIGIIDDIQLYPQQFYNDGIELMISSYRRTPVDSFDVRVKSLNYLNNIVAKIEAKNNGYLECIMLDTNGFVAECTGDNVFIVKNDILKTPALFHGALEGITRNTVIEIAKKIGLQVEITTLTRTDLYLSDECFITGTGAEILPVINIDKIIIGGGKPGSITRAINDAYMDIVRH